MSLDLAVFMFRQEGKNVLV